MKPILWAFAAGLLSAGMAILMPNYYRSQAQLLPVETKQAGGLGNLAATVAALGVGMPMGEGLDANFVDILQSRWIKESVLNTEFRFHVRSWRFGADRPRRETLYAYLEEKNMDRAVKALDGILTASRDPKTKVITISAETKSPELSQIIVRHATEQLNRFQIEHGRTRGGEKAAFAELRLAEARREMDQAEEAFRAFLESSRNYQVSADPSVRLRGARLEAELNLRRQLVLTLAINREQALLEAKNDIPILNVLDAGNLPIDKSRPARAIIILLVTLLSGLGAWGWQNQNWLRERLFEDNYDSPIMEKE